MNLASKKLKLIILDLPYDSIVSSDFTRQIYSKMMSLKIRGYQRDYPYGVLPFDNTDLFSTHKIVCEEQGDGSFEPVLAYRSITLERCNKFSINLPIFNIAKECDNFLYARSISNVIDNFKAHPHKLSYDSIWTLDPKYRSDKSMGLFFKDVMTAIHVLYHEQMQIPYVLAGGVHRFKLERTYHYWGYENLKWLGEVLPPHPLKHLSNQETGSMFFLKSFSEEAKKVAESFRWLWDDRIHISSESNEITKKKEAA